MTRVGHMSKIIWCGDYRQTDLNKKKNDMSGILKFFEIATRMKAFTKIEFTPDDIVRSSLVKDYILAKMDYEDANDWFHNVINFRQLFRNMLQRNIKAYIMVSGLKRLLLTNIERNYHVFYIY